MDDPLLDTPELSRLTKIPKRTLDQWAYLGKGPAYIRIGRHRRYDPADVRAWLAKQRHGGPDAAA